MKRKRITKTVICMLLTAILVLSNFSIITYAKEGKVLTKKYMESKYNTSKIKTVYITDAVVKIEDGTFSNFRNLKEIIVKSNNYYASYKGCLYNKDYTVLICVPTKLYDIRIKSTVTSCMSHAFDGHPKYVIDQFTDLFGIVPGKVKTTKQKTTEVSKQESKKETTKKTTNKKNTTTTKKTTKNVDMSKYVYTDSYGRKYFKYTGSGLSHITVPNGVQYITGFSSSSKKLNYEIKSITLPYTFIGYTYSKYYKNEGDNTDYCVFYQCPNLKKISFSTGKNFLGGYVYVLKNNGTYMQYGDVKREVLPMVTPYEWPIWSASKRIPRPTYDF